MIGNKIRILVTISHRHAGERYLERKRNKFKKGKKRDKTHSLQVMVIYLEKSTELETNSRTVKSSICLLDSRLLCNNKSMLFHQW